MKELQCYVNDFYYGADDWNIPSCDHNDVLTQDVTHASHSNNEESNNEETMCYDDNIQINGDCNTDGDKNETGDNYGDYGVYDEACRMIENADNNTYCNNTDNKAYETGDKNETGCDYDTGDNEEHRMIENADDNAYHNNTENKVYETECDYDSACSNNKETMCCNDNENATTTASTIMNVSKAGTSRTTRSSKKITTTSSSKKTTTTELEIEIGTRIKVCWPTDDQFYEGKIMRRHGSDKFTIHCEDGEIEKLNLSNETYEV